MWVLTPLFGIFLGAIFLTGNLIGYIWLGNISPKKPLIIYLIKGFRGFLFSVYAYYAILFLDSIVKILGFGVLGYDNIWFHAMGLILMFILAVFFLFIAVFNAPTLQTLISFICIVGFCIYYFDFYLPTIFIGEKDVLIKTPFIAIGILIGTNLLTLPLRILKYIKKSTLDFDILWNISENMKNVINIKSFLALWIFFMVESILQLEGLSILYWIGIL